MYKYIFIYIQYIFAFAEGFGIAALANVNETNEIYRFSNIRNTSNN